MEEEKKTKEIINDDSIAAIRNGDNQNDGEDLKVSEMKPLEIDYPTNDKEEEKNEILHDNSKLNSSDSIQTEQIEDNDENSLEKIPPDFEDARIHRDAQRVK